MKQLDNVRKFKKHKKSYLISLLTDPNLLVPIHDHDLLIDKYGLYALGSYLFIYNSWFKPRNG